MAGWVVGFAVGGVVVLLVVALLLTMIVLTRRINARAEAVHEQLLAARDHTRALWALSATNATLDEVAEAAVAARQRLEERHGAVEPQPVSGAPGAPGASARDPAPDPRAGGPGTSDPWREEPGAGGLP